MPSQNEVVKMSYKEKQILGSSEENILGRKQGIEMTHKLDSKEPVAPEENEKRQEWAEELRAADERASNFRAQVAKLQRELADSKETLQTLKAHVPVSYTHLTLPTICSV
eukprot:TRINITY_DN8286_c0_g1_i1.p2 TRINITY_DN8286_c0_g1~~TRINITY_DN8286_c0_g1_i1.p2  ORF type:complete len:110 (+),score=30.95 TRINITY_DN8286_c0_g1_i1:591-920(+)